MMTKCSVIEKAGSAKELERYDLYCSEIKVEKEHWNHEIRRNVAL